jgi:zinc-binding alcohol dehydrogenase/oxidoreductase
MQAILVAETHQPVTLTTLETPTPGLGQALVKLRAAALNHRDVFVQQGLYPGMKLPVIPGADGAGVVAEIGENVDNELLGREVIINCSLDWGDNPNFYGPKFRILGMPDNGTFAEYVLVEAHTLHAKPAHLTFEEAAALPLAGLTAWRALMNRAQLSQTHAARVLITGTGGGAALFALQFAVAAGAEVWVTSGSDEKIERAKALGATGGINYKEKDWHKTLMAQTGGGRNGYFDVIIDSAAGPGFTLLTDVAAPGGRIAMFGGTAGKIDGLIPPKLFFKQLNIMGSTMGTPAEFTEMVAFVNQHQIRPVIDVVMPLAEAEAALRRMDAGQQFGKIVLAI